MMNAKLYELITIGEGVNGRIYELEDSNGNAVVTYEKEVIHVIDNKYAFRKVLRKARKMRELIYGAIAAVIVIIAGTVLLNIIDPLSQIDIYRYKDGRADGTGIHHERVIEGGEE